ncbi:DUF4232 domain-containing protein [Streptomyces sp. NPDC053427]|uniref:DUF4232 domain-containing protein n=1 Tax=Streptomyces sp. NPDC053427 TaxID=3365701 RepID=UPI0037CF19C8
MPYAATAGRRLTAVTLMAAAGLSLTSCDHDGGSRPGAPARPSAASRPPAPGTRIACTPEMLRFHARGIRHPAHRMLLTVTNYSDKPCDFAAQPYPLLRLGARQRAVTPAIGASDPGTVITLAPDGTAYAGVTTSAAADGAPRRGERISQFGVALAPRTAPCQVGLDGGPPVRVNPRTAKVTYWQSRREAALKW